MTIPELIVNWVECITDDMAGTINNLEEQVDYTAAEAPLVRQKSKPPPRYSWIITPRGDYANIVLD